MSRRLICAALVCTAGLAIVARGDEVHTIPLESVYSTSYQKGLKRVVHGSVAENKYVEPFGYYLEKLHRDFRSGPTNVLLVRGKDIDQAVKTTVLAFLGNRGADVPVDPEDGSKPTHLWVVAYLGSAGSGTNAALPIQSVERDGKNIRLAYRVRGNEHKDVWPYFFWIPLGELERGTYTLELFDTDKKEVTLLRRVTW